MRPQASYEAVCLMIVGLYELDGKWNSLKSLIVLKKISFIFEFIEKRNDNIIIWDADTIIIQKIDFFNKNLSNNHGTTSYYHRAYYETNKFILKKLPPYFISNLTKFISITPK